MRKYLTILVILFSLSAKAQIQELAELTTAPGGQYALLVDSLLRGGFRAGVQDTAARNAITGLRRKVGMWVITRNNNGTDGVKTVWELLGTPLSNNGTNWGKVSFGDVSKAYVDAKNALNIPYIGATKNPDIGSHRLTADSTYSHRNVTIGDTTFTKSSFRIFFYGNSVTAGVYINYEYQKWANIVARSLAMGYFNRGIGGTTMSRVSAGDSSAVDRAPTMAAPKSSRDRIILSYGINDSRNGTGINDTTIFKTSYASVLATLLGKGWTKDQMLIQTPTPYYLKAYIFVTNEINFINATINFAKANGIRYADTYHALLPFGQTVMSPDSLHPNPAGHALIAQTILQAGKFTPVPTLVNNGRTTLNGQLNVAVNTLDTTLLTVNGANGVMLKLDAGPVRGNTVSFFGTDSLKNNYLRLFGALPASALHSPGTVNFGQGFSLDTIPKLILVDVPGAFAKKYTIDASTNDGFVFNPGTSNKFLFKGSVVIPSVNKYILGTSVFSTDFLSNNSLNMGTTMAAGPTTTPAYVVTGDDYADVVNAPDKLKYYLFGKPGNTSSVGLGYSGSAGMELIAGGHPISYRAGGHYWYDNTNTVWMNLQSAKLGIGIGSAIAGSAFQVGSRIANADVRNSTIASLGGTVAAGDVYPLTLHNASTPAVGNAAHLTYSLGTGFLPTADLGAVLTSSSGPTDFVMSLSTGSAPSEKFRFASTGLMTSTTLQTGTLQIPNYIASNVTAITNGTSAFPAYNYFQNGFFYCGPQSTAIGLQPYDASDLAIGTASTGLKGLRLDHLTLPSLTQNSFLVINSSGKTSSLGSYSGTSITFPADITITSGMYINGTTSGKALIGVQPNAGNVQFNIPVTNGTAGQAYVSGGGGANPGTWATLPISITASTLSASGTASVNNRYYANSTTRVVLTLPTVSAMNDVIYIVGVGTGGWQVAQLAGQVIHGNSDTTTGTGGYIQSQQKSNCVELRCVVANTEWTVVNSNGVLTYF